MKKKLAVVLIISLFIAAMLPANVALAVTHVIESGQVVNLSEPSYVHGDVIQIDTTEPVELMNGSGKDISIECLVDNVNITFNNLELQSTEFGIAFNGGTGNTLTLKGLSELFSGDDYPVIYVPLGVELTIQNGEAAGVGELYADGSEGGGAGIGSDYEDTGIANKITINDVVIEAYGGDGCAGIGTSNNVTIGQITSVVIINNASVLTYGGEEAAGIGGGAGANGDVEIYNGTIAALGGRDGAGIGGGYAYEVFPDTFLGGRGDVHIEGTSQVLAAGGRDGAGIGGGYNGEGHVTIMGGAVEAHGGESGSSDGIDYLEGGGAGIGGGDSADGYVNIHGGEVYGYVAASANEAGAGIGGGRAGDGTVNIYGGAVFAQGGMDSAGIGGGAGEVFGIIPGAIRGEGYSKPTGEAIFELAVVPEEPSVIGGNGYVHIEGEPLVAGFGYRHGAGIGGGVYGDGHVDIYGGQVFAVGGLEQSGIYFEGFGAGIGGGGTEIEEIDGGSGFVNIYGGIIGAHSQLAAAGIGGSLYGDGTVLIAGGDVEATGGYDGAGIGSGPEAAAYVTITGGKVETFAEHGSEAGIGNGYYGTAGTVDISGGLVIARGGLEPSESAAGIGGGVGSAFGEINITGGQVYALAGTNESDDIGAASFGTCTGVNISGNSAVFMFYDNFSDLAPVLAPDHMHIDDANPNLQIVTANAAYGYTNFPDEWNTYEGYGYLRGYVVEFNHQDGTSNFETVWAGLPVAQPADPSRLGYIFNYWHTDPQGVNPYDFNLPVLSDMIIYADWVEQGTHSGTIQGTLENPVGMPLQGYNITLQSQPVTVFTSNTGSFTFGSVFYINHTLIIKDMGGVELKRYAVTMVEGNSPGAVVDNDAGTIVITYVGDTTSVTIPLMYDGRDVIVSGPIIVDGTSSGGNEVVNPRTGEMGSNSFAVVLIALLILVSVGFIVRRKAAAGKR